MITDVLANAHLYRSLHGRLAAAFDFLQNSDLLNLPLGKTVIDGERLFALVQEYTPKPAAACRLEAHRRYWDVQYVASGTERMCWGNLSQMVVDEPYDTARDVGFFHGAGSLILVPAGSFTVFGPQDVHMPGVALDEAAGLVRKIVVKVEGWT